MIYEDTRVHHKHTIPTYVFYNEDDFLSCRCSIQIFFCCIPFVSTVLYKHVWFSDVHPSLLLFWIPLSGTVLDTLFRFCVVYPSSELCFIPLIRTMLYTLVWFCIVYPSLVLCCITLFSTVLFTLLWYCVVNHYYKLYLQSKKKHQQSIYGTLLFALIAQVGEIAD